MSQVKQIIDSQEDLALKAIRKLNRFLDIENPSEQELNQSKAWRAIIDQYHTHKNIITKQVNTILTVGHAITNNPDELHKYLEFTDIKENGHKAISLTMGKIVDDASRVPELEAKINQKDELIQSLQAELAREKDTLVKPGE